MEKFISKKWLFQFGMMVTGEDLTILKSFQFDSSTFYPKLTDYFIHP